MDAKGIGGGQGQDGNGDGSAGCIDGGSQGNGNGVHVRIQSQPAAEGEVHRDVSGAASGKEGIDAAFLQRSQHQGIGIPVDPGEYEEGIDDKGYGGIGTDEDRQQFHISKKGGKAFAAYGIGHKAHDAQGRQVDDPAHDLCDRLGRIVEELFRLDTAHRFQGDTENDGPHQDADVVCLQDGGYRVIDGAHDQVIEYFADAAGSGCIRSGRRRVQGQGCGEEERKGNPHDGSEEGTCHVQSDDRLHIAPLAGLFLGDGVDDEEEHQHRRHALQCLHKEVAEYPDQGYRLRQADGQDNAQYQAHGDLVDEFDMGKQVSQFRYQRVLLI